MGGVADAVSSIGHKAVFGDQSKPDPAQRLVTQAERDKALADFDASGGKSFTGDIFLGFNDQEKAASISKYRKQLEDTLLVPPPPTPDESDTMVKQAQAAARRRLLSGGGLTGPLDLTPQPAQKPGLVGY